MSNHEAKNLIERYLNNQCSPEERQLIEDWLDQYQAEQNIVADTDLESRLIHIRQRLVEETQPTPFTPEDNQPIYTPLWKKYRKYAAVFLAGGLAFASYHFYSKYATDNAYAQHTLILPGEDRAFIQYDDGSPIQLNEKNNGISIKDKHVLYANGDTVTPLEESAKGAQESQRITIRTPRGGQFKVTLPDGSLIWLNSDSKVVYNTAGQHNREINIEGEVYLEVAHNPSIPFRVQSKGQLIEVLGTHFNINSYPEEKEIKTTLLQGKVRVTNLASPKNNVSILAPGQQAVISEQGNKINADIDTEEITAWKDGYFKFNETLNPVLKKLSRWYNADFILDSNIDPQILVVGKLSRKTELKDVLDILCASADLKYQIQGRRITFMK